jgi:hypothetical protein
MRDRFRGELIKTNVGFRPLMNADNMSSMSSP